MFTGIIHTIGEVTRRSEIPEGVRFTVRAANFCDALRLGDSVSINGVCHTVEASDTDTFDVTSVGETLGVTTMGSLAAGDRVNLEPAATVETALGGHIVQGHVDGVGTVVSFERQGADRLLTIEVPADVHDVTVRKGSIAIDGVSLTVIDRLDNGMVTITIVPHTLEMTTFASYDRGRRVNVEADVLGKYVRQYIDRLQPESN